MRTIRTVLLIMVVGAAVAYGQEVTSTAENPLPALKDEVQRVLATALLPFTEDQEKAIVLMMEERRQASEELFGQTMDFRAGPTQGQQVDRARDAIQWMRNEFITRLQDYLTPDQLAAWGRSQESGTAVVESTTNRPAAAQQTQYVRINNNVFSADSGGYRTGGFGNQTEVFQRGGTGAWHGNAEFLIKDEALNARNPFAHNKPPYQERQISFSVSGPAIRNRLTTSFSGSHNRSENVDTIHATTPQGLFDLGIAKPTISRSISTRGNYQISDIHSLNYNVRYSTSSRENQNTGGFNLLDRASNSTGSDWNIELRQFSTISSRTIFESRFNIGSNHDETIPVSNAVQINVLDAFRSGGAQNRAENDNRNYDFSNMYTRLGETLTVKTGVEGVYRMDRLYSEGNFGGTFTFSNLESYLDGRPLNYRVNRGEPLVQTNQLELSFFLQTDLKLTPRLTLMMGGRYDYQTNLADHNNLGPRLALAYALGQAMVIRAGGGIYYSRIGTNIIETQRRLDGTRQYEIVIDNPSYPDPFQAGTIRETFPSIRVTDPTLVAQYNEVAMVSFERTFFSNLFFSALYDFNRGVNRLKYRNLNAPLPGQTTRPDPTRGNILNLEPSGNGFTQNIRLNVRQRFSIFNVSGSYTYNRIFDDGSPNNPDLPTNNYNLRADWSRGPVARHSVSGNLNARLPLGVFLTGSISANSSRPYNITTGKDDNADTQVNDRPPGVPRFSADGPGFIGVDFNISKAIFFTEPAARGGTRTNVNFFANMTNAFNHTNPGTPSGVITSPNFGKSTSAMSPREIEAGLRFQF